MVVGAKPLRVSWSAAGFPLDNRRWQAGLHSVLKLGPNQHVKKGGERGHGFFRERPPYHNKHSSCFGGNLFAMDGGWEGIVHENDHVF